MACGPGDEGAGDRARPRESEPATPLEQSFVGSASCAECHAEPYAAWQGSHHDRAMQVAEEGTVLGDFDDARFRHGGVASRFFKKERRFFVNTEGPDGESADFEIRYAFGFEPLQQYLIALPGGRFQALGIAWDARPKGEGGQRWFHLYPDERLAPGDPLHWTGRYQTWNAMCAECHSTNLRKRYNPETDTYATSWSEIDVACEACHGPGARHVEWARQREEGEGAEEREPRLVVDFADGDARFEIDSCGRCHARRRRVSAEDRPGRPFLDHFVPANLREGFYGADGQIEGEVYVYGSFLQSRMYEQGVRCSDCHDPHSLELRAEDNALCARCHGAKSDPRFPTLPGKPYDTPAHHFHPQGSPGARCVACHMPARIYMGVDPRRDHSFRMPRPDLTLKIGTPNACNECHADRSAQWAAGALTKRYGAARYQKEHFGEVIAAGRAGAPEAAASLVALGSDAQQPAIVRATALELLSRYGPAAVEALLTATRDDDPIVRITAASRLEALPPERRRGAALWLLRDPVRAVRLAAARALASEPRESLSPTQRRALEAALGEYEAAQRAGADLSGGRFNLALLYASRGEPERAAQAYRMALRMDPDFLPARANLAVLYNQMGRNEDAERVLREGIERAPDEGELHYSLGLLLAEEEHLEEAAEALGRAAALLPGRARVRYNHALALQRLGRADEAEQALLAAQRLEPGDPALLNALAVFYAQRERWQEALPFARELVERAPATPEARQLLEQIRSELSSTGAGDPR